MGASEDDLPKSQRGAHSLNSLSLTPSPFVLLWWIFIQFFSFWGESRAQTSTNTVSERELRECTLHCDLGKLSSEVPISFPERILRSPGQDIGHP